MNIHKEIVRLRTVSTIALLIFIPTVNIFAVIGDILVWVGSGGDKRRPLSHSRVFFGLSALLYIITVPIISHLNAVILDDGHSTLFYYGLMSICVCGAVISAVMIIWLSKILKNISDDKPFFD